MRHRVKGPGVVKEYCADVQYRIHAFVPLICCGNKCSSGRFTTREAPLHVKNWTMFFKMANQEVSNMFFEKFA